MLTGDGLTLFVGLTPVQQACLTMGNAIVPDSHSSRFGLRTTCRAAIERAHHFMEWSPEGPKNEVRLEDMRPYQIKFTPYGYMKMVEGGTLVYTKPGEYRFNDVLHASVWESGKLVYEVVEVEYLRLTPDCCTTKIELVTRR